MRFRLFAVVAFAALSGMILVGCGGGSSSPSTRSPFAGAYSGTFSAVTQGQNQNGTLSATVGTDGKLTGSSTNTTVGATATVTGSVSNSGALTTTLTFPNATYTASGTVSKNSAGHMVGSLTQYSGNTNFGTITIDLTPN